MNDYLDEQTNTHTYTQTHLENETAKRWMICITNESMDYENAWTTAVAQGKLMKYDFIVVGNIETEKLKFFVKWGKLVLVK